ncbi:hypothetical protein BGW80DRAFT_1305927 [Lactifluus volemus]|nr:hypothetical protein BGW80DRAFT_1305927 [Lactifluus volemus]
MIQQADSKMSKVLCRCLRVVRRWSIVKQRIGLRNGFLGGAEDNLWVSVVKVVRKWELAHIQERLLLPEQIPSCDAYVGIRDPVPVEEEVISERGSRECTDEIYLHSVEGGGSIPCHGKRR